MADPVRVQYQPEIGPVANPDDLARAILAVLATDAGQRAVREGVRAELRDILSRLPPIGDGMGAPLEAEDIARAIASVAGPAPTPREPAQDGGEHDWFVPPSIGYECCRRCGIVKRADGKNKPCRGPVRVEPREPAQDEPAAGAPQDPPDSGDDPFSAADAAGFARGIEAAAKLVDMHANDPGTAASLELSLRVEAQLIRALTPPAAPDPLLPGLRAAREKARQIHAREHADLAVDLWDLVCWLDAEIARRGA